MEYDVVTVIFVGCTAVVAVVGSIVEGWIVGDNDGCADIKVVEATVGLTDGAATLVCRLVGEMLGELVDVIVGCAVLVGGLAVGRIVGVAVVGAIVGFVVLIDGLAVGRIVGATVLSTTVGEVVGSRRIVGAIVGAIVGGRGPPHSGHAAQLTSWHRSIQGSKHGQPLSRQKAWHDGGTP